MKKTIYTLIIFLVSIQAKGELGETQITAEEGIEVFQKEKYYLLKKNVEIVSDNFNLNADVVKAYFEKDLYDIINIYAEGNVSLDSKEKGINATGNVLEFSFNEETIKITGANSVLNLTNCSMFSNGIIHVNNSVGTFYLNGNDSTLKNEDIFVSGKIIDGKFLSNNNINEIVELNVEDENISNIKTEKIDMYSLKAKYNKNNNLIELNEKVKVIRGDEIITGDYGYVDLEKNSYKVTSNNSKKVKVLIKQSNE